MPLIRILVLAFALAHATGVLDAFEAACAEDCDEGDRCADGCAPMCATCQCTRCPTVAPVEAVAMTPAVRAPARAAAFADVERAVASPDPREILHVPIALRV